VLYGDAEMYMASQRFNKPGTIPLQTQTEIRDGCPLDCGLCPDHKQHACLGIIEVNTSCNLDCPVCFADSGHQPDGFSLRRTSGLVRRPRWARQPDRGSRLAWPRTKAIERASPPTSSQLIPAGAVWTALAGATALRSTLARGPLAPS